MKNNEYNKVLKLISELEKVCNESFIKGSKDSEQFYAGHLCACDDLRFRIKDLMNIGKRRNKIIWKARWITLKRLFWK